MEKKNIKMVMAVFLGMTLLLMQDAITVRAEAVVSNPKTVNNVTTWDCIYFGNYYQDIYTPINLPDNPVSDKKYIDVDGTEYIYRTWDDFFFENAADEERTKVTRQGYFKKQPIKWRVLSVDSNNNAVVIADKGLDCKQYNIKESEDRDVSCWDTCTLRSWLNGYGSTENDENIDYSTTNFINQAFSSKEQLAVMPTYIDTSKGGEEINDKIFLLSEDDVCNPSYGFNLTFLTESQSRVCKSTAYARSEGVQVGDNYPGWLGETWWLRGSYIVNDDGWGRYHLYQDWGNADTDCIAVRPALKVKLSSTYVKAAGTVSASVSGEPIEHVHNYFSSVTKEATCQSAGVKTFTCSCGDAYVELISKNSSKHVGAIERKGVEESQIGKAGYSGDTYCKGCGMLLSKGKRIPALSLNKQTITVKNKTVKYDKLKAKKMTIKLEAKTNGDGVLSYKVTKYPKGMKNYISVSKKGYVTLEKKAKKGTYKIKITASKTKQYDTGTKVVTIKVK